MGKGKYKSGGHLCRVRQVTRAQVDIKLTNHASLIACMIHLVEIQPHALINFTVACTPITSGAPTSRVPMKSSAGDFSSSINAAALNLISLRLQRCTLRVPSPRHARAARMSNAGAVT